MSPTTLTIGAIRSFVPSFFRVLVLLATGCAAMSSLAQSPLTFDEVAALPAPPPNYRIAYGTDPLQFGNLRLPKKSGPHPVVIFIHGGCYLSQYKISHVAALEQAFANAGYAVWSIEYRRVGDKGGGWPGTFQDVGRAADHLRTLAAQYPLDLQRVVAVGHSAGANFALWLAARNRIRPDSPLRVERPLAINAVLALAPIPDLAALHTQRVCGNVIDRLMGDSPKRVPERYRDVSPVLLLPIGIPQILVVGGQDDYWRTAGLAYHKLAIAAGDSLVRLIEVAAAGHFDLIAPTTTSWNLVIEALQDLFKRIQR